MWPARVICKYMPVCQPVQAANGYKKGVFSSFQSALIIKVV